jgi:hypothetical protein
MLKLSYIPLPTGSRSGIFPERRISPKIGGGRQLSVLISARTAGGRIRCRLSWNPPPVMWAIPLIAPPSFVSISNGRTRGA